MFLELKGRIFFDMKYFGILFLLFLAQLGLAANVMPRVSVKLFVNHGKTDFETVFSKDKEAKKAAVNWLFENNRLDHDFSKAVSPDLEFGPYWEHFAEMWHLVDLDLDGKNELIFSGKPIVSDEKERFALFANYGQVWKEVFWDDGHLMAYKIHPNTGEIILYHHRYPCCTNSTHLIQKIRWLRNRLHSTKRYFLARDKDMKGQFFPKKAFYPSKYRILKSETMLYWSKGKINAKAAVFSPKNEIIHFPANAYYQILAREGAWKYVMMVSPPKTEESMVANPANLQESRFYGWIKI
jgi:hypothetical protein